MSQALTMTKLFRKVVKKVQLPAASLSFSKWLVFN